jgi:hypothetical protein
MESHQIDCVLKDIPSQLVGVQWTTKSNTANVYSPQDGTIKGTSQTSTLSLSSTQLVNLKKVGDVSVFTCKIFVGDLKTAVAATQSITVYTPS